MRQKFQCNLRVRNRVENRPCREDKITTMSYVAADFRLICAWCNTEMKAPQSQQEQADEVPESHGVCRSCAIQMGLPEDRIVF